MPKMNTHLFSVSRTSPPYADPNKIRLHASERDYPYSDVIWNDFLVRLKPTDIMYYPNIDCAYDVLEQFCGIQKHNLTLFDGSSNGIRNLFSLFVTPHSKVISTNPSFPMYRVYADMYQAEFTAIDYTYELFPLREMIDAIDENTSVVIISNPSSPVGDMISYADLVILSNKCYDNNVLLIVDEAYIEFSEAKTFATYAMSHDHVIVLRTFSKAFGSAGARIGYAVSTETNKNHLTLVRSMNEISGCSVKWMETLCDHKSDAKNYIEAVIKNRNIIETQNIIRGRSVICSQTNFIHVSDLVLPYDFVYRSCKMPWTDIQYSRISIPANVNTADRLIQY
jgi:histidinol-phosphate aminotransferase